MSETKELAPTIQTHTELVEAQGNDALDAIFQHVQELPYEPGFMAFKPLKGAKSFNAGTLGTMDSPIETIVLSCNTRRGLWPWDGKDKENLSAALGVLSKDLPKPEVEKVNAWRRTRPLCGSSGNNGVMGKPCDVLDDDTPGIVNSMLGVPMDANFKCGECKWNEYGSDLKGGRGKNCKETLMLLLYFPNNEVVATLSLPPTSLSAWRDYKKSLPKQNFSWCWTAIHTVPYKDEATSQEWNIMSFEPVKDDGVKLVVPSDVADLGQQVVYQNKHVIKFNALVAEFLNIELVDDVDYDTNGVTSSEPDTAETEEVSDEDDNTPF